MIILLEIENRVNCIFFHDAKIIPNEAGSPPTTLCSVTLLYPQLGGYKGPYAVFVISF